MTLRSVDVLNPNNVDFISSVVPILSPVCLKLFGEKQVPVDSNLTLPIEIIEMAIFPRVFYLFRTQVPKDEAVIQVELGHLAGGEPRFRHTQKRHLEQFIVNDD